MNKINFGIGLLFLLAACGDGPHETGQTSTTVSTTSESDPRPNPTLAPPSEPASEVEPEPQVESTDSEGLAAPAPLGDAEEKTPEAQNDSIPATTPTRMQEQALGPNDYEFFGKDYDGAACSTGRQKFASKHLMCINIQEAEANGNCALVERYMHFEKHCEPAGYKFMESLKCRVTILDRSAAFPKFGQPVTEGLVASTSFCTGFMRTGEVLSGDYLKGFVYGDVMIESSTRFVEEKNRRSDYSSRIALRLFRQVDVKKYREKALTQKLNILAINFKKTAARSRTGLTSMW